MAALSDHDRRDAEHVARAEISIRLQRYARRWTEESKTIIREELDEAARLGRSVDAVALGRDAAERAAAKYLGVEAGAQLHPAIDAAADPADGFA